MNMKQILFNTEMVRVIMEGRKTVTRRVVKPQPKGAHTVLDCDDYEQTFDMLCGNGGEGGVFLDWAETIKAPCWAGDILWVRETWAKNPFGDGYIYPTEVPGAGQKWKPSIYMPREAARIFLLVTCIRVERLQDCGNMQAKDEGCVSCSQFARVWDSTIKPADLHLYGWEANPWVWVIEFERISKDEALGGG
jgi:hypothetical protein